MLNNYDFTWMAENKCKGNVTGWWVWKVPSHNHLTTGYILRNALGGDFEHQTS